MTTQARETPPEPRTVAGRHMRQRRWLDNSIRAIAQRKAIRIAAAARKVDWAYRHMQSNPALFSRRMDELHEAITDKEDRL